MNYKLMLKHAILTMLNGDKALAVKFIKRWGNLDTTNAGKVWTIPGVAGYVEKHESIYWE